MTIIISKRQMLISRHDPVFVFVYSGGCDHYHKKRQMLISRYNPVFVFVYSGGCDHYHMQKTNVDIQIESSFLSFFIQVVVTSIISKRQMLISRHDPVFVFVYSGGCDHYHKQTTNVDIQT